MAVLLIAAGLLLIQPQTSSGASAAAPQGKGGAIKPVPTATSAPKKANKPPEGKPTEKRGEAPTTSQTKTADKTNTILDPPAVTITTFQSLSRYDSSASGDLYTVVMPNVSANFLSVRSGSVPLKDGSRGSGFDNLRIEQRGNDAVLSLRLQAGAYARVHRRVVAGLEKLDIFIFFSKPDNAATSSATIANRTANDISGTRATPPVSDTNSSNSPAANPNVRADRNATDNNNANSNVGPSTLRAPSTPRMADPNEGSKTVPMRIDQWPNIGSRIEPEPKPDAGLLIPVSSNQQFRYTKGEFSELSGKRRIIVNADSAATADRIIARLREYGGLEIVKTAGEAEFALNANTWTSSGDIFMGITKTFTGGSLIVTIRDTSLPVPCVIWNHTESGGNGAFDKLVKHFIQDLKKLRGEK